MLCFTHWALCPWRKSILHPLNRKLDGVQRQHGRFGNKLWFQGWPARRVVSVLPKHSRLHIFCSRKSYDKQKEFYASKELCIILSCIHTHVETLMSVPYRINISILTILVLLRLLHGEACKTRRWHVYSHFKTLRFRSHLEGSSFLGCDPVYLIGHFPTVYWPMNTTLHPKGLESSAIPPWESRSGNRHVIAVAQLFVALRHKPDGRGFDSWWVKWDFSFT